MKSAPIVPLIIFLNCAIFLLWSYGGIENQEFMQNNFSVSWEALLQGRWWVLLTSAFSQNLFFHLFFNMFVLTSFGQVIESVLGSRFFLVFYLIAGIFSSLMHALVSAFLLGKPDLAAVGASGAIAGVLLLFCLLFPKEKLLFLGIIPLPAIWGAVAFVSLDVWGLITQAEGGGLPIGHGAHLGGAFCGLVAYFYLRTRVQTKNRAIKKSTLLAILGITLSLQTLPSKAEASSQKVSLHYSPACILKLVASRYNTTLRPEVPLPDLFFESTTPLSQFQDAIESQWGFRPEDFTNAYSLARNQIFLIDQKSYYEKNERSIDDSLAHEYIHYLQVKYRGYRLEDLDDAAELDAVSIQTWFRESFILQKPTTNPCP